MQDSLHTTGNALNIDEAHRINAYDFDGTIYQGDSTLDFTLYCMRRQPWILRALPHWGRALALAIKTRNERPGSWWDKTACKEHFYKYLPYVQDLNGVVEDFWRINIKKVYPWYLKVKRSSDVVVSASPRFLLDSACARLGVSLIASEVDPTTGRCLSRNCHGRVKADRFRRRYPDAVIDAFYSDSLSDEPMAKLSYHAFLVKNGKVDDWPV